MIPQARPGLCHGGEEAQERVLSHPFHEVVALAHDLKVVDQQARQAVLLVQLEADAVSAAAHVDHPRDLPHRDQPLRQSRPHMLEGAEAPPPRLVGLGRLAGGAAGGPSLHAARTMSPVRLKLNLVPSAPSMVRHTSVMHCLQVPGSR